MASSSSSSSAPPPRVMENPNQELLLLQQQQQQQQVLLKCPRCHSSNTKFCYYNNYSLSQPRHFCKACKRYWTRGGTLRNVPVGGGCRKNKRSAKRPLTSTTAVDTGGTAPPPSSSSSSSSSRHARQIDVTSTSNRSRANPLFYGLPSSTSCDMNILPLTPRFDYSGARGYDELQPPMDCLGLDFASGGVMYGDEASDHDSYRNGFSSSSTLLSRYNNTSSILGNLSSAISTTPTSSTTTPIMSSSLHQQKFIINGAAAGGGGANTFQGFASEMVALKEEKSAEGQNRFGWNNNNNNNNGPWPNYYQIEHVGLSSDPSLYWNVATTMGTSLLE